MLAFVSENGTVDALLSAIVDELAPDEHGVALQRPQHEFFAGANEQFSPAPIGVSVRAVVPLVEREAIKVTILG